MGAGVKPQAKAISQIEAEARVADNASPYPSKQWSQTSGKRLSTRCQPHGSAEGPTSAGAFPAGDDVARLDLAFHGLRLAAGVVGQRAAGGEGAAGKACVGAGFDGG